MAKIEATDKTSGRTYSAHLDIPATSDGPAFDAFFGGAQNVRELALGALVVRVQANLRDKAKSGVNKVTGKPWTAAEQQAGANSVVEAVREGPRHKVDKVTKVTKGLEGLSAEQLEEIKAAIAAKLANKD